MQKIDGYQSLGQDFEFAAGDVFAVFRAALIAPSAVGCCRMGLLLKG